jgi:hypothetical protein
LFSLPLFHDFAGFARGALLSHENDVKPEFKAILKKLSSNRSAQEEELLSS